MKNFSTCAAALAVAGILSACGGGSGENPMAEAASPLFSSSEAARIQAITNAGAPEETGEEIVQRRQAQDRSDWRKGSVQWSASSNVTEELFAALQDLADDFYEEHGTNRYAVLTKDGITLDGQQAQGGRGYGSTMEHNGFGVFTTDALGGGIMATASGNQSGSAPDASATWRGIMVAAVKDDSRDLLQGDAAIMFDFSTSMVDANFTNIVNLDKIAVHSTQTVTFHDIPVSADGTWKSGTGTFDGATPNFIHGGFAGPSHQAAAGMFWTPDMTGAFGAKR